MTELRQKLRGTTTELNAGTADEGLIAYDQVLHNLRVYDGLTLGGYQIPNLDQVNTLLSALETSLEAYADAAEADAKSYTDSLAGAIDARTLTAGDGLTGGGDLSDDRDFALGTPGTLTSATANAVTADSHTHELNVTNIVAAGMTGLGLAAIGTYAFLRHNQTPSTLNAGDNRAGTNLQYNNAGGAGSPGNPPGTWKCMGYVGNTNVADGPTRTTLFMRIL